MRSLRFFALLALLSTASAYATVFAPMTDRDLINRSDAIVVGTVKTAECRKGADGYIYTDYRLASSDVLKGAVATGDVITIREFGGQFDGRLMLIEATARYQIGQEVLTFLRQRPDGTYFTAGMIRGAFNFSRNIAGEPIAVRDLADEAPDEPVRLREGFIAFIRGTVKGLSTSESYVSASPESFRNLVPKIDGSAKNYSFSPAIRWNCSVSGSCSIPFFEQSTPPAGASSAISAAMAAWNNDPNSNVAFSDGGVKPAAPPSIPPTQPQQTNGQNNPDDNQNTIYFSQATFPSGIPCDGAIACTVLASSGATATFDGDPFLVITDVDILLTSATNADQAVIAHEFGHALGIRHSNAGTPSATNAVMNPSPSLTTLQQWDKDAVDSLYGNGVACVPATSVTINGGNQTVTPGSRPFLTATPSPADPGGANAYTYQWFIGASGDTSNPDASSSTANYQTPAINTPTQFWVRVKNSCTTANVDSPAVTISPATNTCVAAAISTQPQSQSIGSGTTATLSVGVTGSAPFGYQWYEGTFPDTSKPVATTASFTTPPLTKATSYWVHVSNACGLADSQTASITIIGQCIAPAITVSPASRTLSAPRQVALVVNATGDAPLTFQWFNADSPNQANPVSGLSPSDDRFVRALYVDLLGREPDAGTLAALVGLLGSNTKQTVASTVLTSTEYRSALISSYYTQYLRRTASASDISFFLPLFSTPGTTDEYVQSLFLGSPEYFTNMAGGTNANFINQLFSDVLGRTPSAAESTNFLNLLGSGFSRSDVALLVLTSSEYRQRLVQSWFTNYLRRSPSSSELANFTGSLNGGALDEQVQAQILGSSEYSAFDSVLITPVIQNQSSYWVRVTNRCTGGANSSTAAISVLSDCNTAGAPGIVTQPQNTTTITGVPAVVGVGATGAGPFAYQWFEGNTGDTTRPVSGQTSAQLKIVTNTVGTRTFWVRVTNGCSRSTNSNAATVTINCGAPAPDINADATVRSGLAHKVSWSGDNTLYSSFELQVATKSDFSDAQTTALPAVQLPAGSLNEKSFTDTVATDTRFYYRVRGKAQCNGQFSEYSRGVSTVVSAAPPSTSTNIVLNVGGNTTFGLVTQDLFIPGFSTSGKMALATTGSFTVNSDRDFVTITPSSGPLPPEGTTVKVSIDTSKVGIGATQANLVITTNDGLGKLGALGASRTTSTSVSAAKTTPVTSTPKDANAGAESLIILAVGHGQGASGPFQSDVRISNLGADARNYQLTFTPAGTDGTQVGKQTQLNIAAGETKALNDIVSAWFGAGGLGEANLGTLEVRPLTNSTGGTTNVGATRTVASSLTYFVQQSGATFGQYIPALPLSQFISSTTGQKMSVQQIQNNSTNRTNFGLVEGSGQPATVELKLLDKNNNQIGITSQSLRGFEFLQRALTDYFPGVSTDDARVEVKVTSPNGKVSAYASVVENQTSDPTLVFPTITNQVLSNRYVVPGVANLLGANNSNFHTDMRVFNAGTTSVPVTMSFSGNGNAAPFNFTLAPGEIRTFNDVVKNTFNLNGAGGAIVATTQSNSSLVLTARTYSIAPTGGTFGQFIPGVTPAQAIGLNESALNITQLEQSPAFRSNAGVVEVTGQAATVRLSLYNPDAKSVPSIDVPLAPNQFVQLGNVFSTAFPGASVYNGRISAQVIGGTGKISAYGSLIDNRSNDPAFIPAQR